MGEQSDAGIGGGLKWQAIHAKRIILKTFLDKDIKQTFVLPKRMQRHPQTFSVLYLFKLVREIVCSRSQTSSCAIGIARSLVGRDLVQLWSAGSSWTCPRPAPDWEVGAGGG